MHIPSSATKDIDIGLFYPALEASLRPSDNYNVERWLYVPNTYSEYRYILGTRGVRPLVCIGINPSTAEPDNLDPTLKSAERIAHHNGYDSFLMFNVYAQRATNPDDMEREYNAWLQQENAKAFSYLLDLCGERPSIWAAWGNLIEKRPYLTSCVADLIRIAAERDAVWYHAGAISAHGHPHHPLYLKKDSALEPFDVTRYL